MRSAVDLFAFLFVAAAPTSVQPPTVVEAPPVSPVITRTGGVPGVLLITWTAGDVDAYTRIYVGPDSSFYPYVTLTPGVITWQSDIAADQSYEVDVSHVKNGIESVLVGANWSG